VTADIKVEIFTAH